MLLLLAHLPAATVPSATVFTFAIPFGFGILYMMGIFTHSDADVAATDSGYPSYLMILPLSSRSLALWPMLYGTLTVSLAWAALVELVLRPRGGILSSAWPAAR